MATSKEKQYRDWLTPVVCDGCDGQDDVTNYCLQCNANICGECKSTHWDTRLHRDHIVLPRTHPDVIRARRSRKIFCQYHTGKEYVTFCTRCKLPCCAICITERHNGHKFSDLEKTISKAESKIDEMVHNMETNWIPVYEKSISQLGIEMATYKKRLNEVKELSKERLQYVIQQLKRLHMVFLYEVDQIGERDLNIIKRKKRELEENLEKVKGMAHKGKKAPVDASLLLILDELSKVSSLRPSKITCPGMPSFSASKFNMSANDILGCFNTTSEKVLFETSTDDWENITEGTSFDSQKVEVKVLKKINGINATSIVNIPEKEVWIYDDKSNYVDMYDDHFNWKNRLNVGFSCYDMTLYDRNEIIAADFGKSQIVRISRSGSKTVLCSREESWCNICVNSKNHIVVGVLTDHEDDCCTEACPWKLLLYSPVQSLILQEMDKNNIFWGFCLNQIRQTASGEYVVAIDANIICYSIDLKSKWTYTFGLAYGSSDILCLCCDQYNNILVGDRKMNEIVILNIEGQRIRTLLSTQDGICNPLSMDIDSKGRLWIGQEKNVLIAAYLK